MLVIRNAQMAALGRPMLERYVRKTLRDIRELFPGDPRFEEEAAVRALIGHGISSARRYGIEGEREVSLYIFLACEYGSDFDTQGDKPWIQSLLAAENLDASSKMDLIYERLRILAAGRSEL
jgi:hypothetical protein